MCRKSKDNSVRCILTRNTCACLASVTSGGAQGVSGLTGQHTQHGGHAWLGRGGFRCLCWCFNRKCCDRSFTMKIFNSSWSFILRRKVRFFQNTPYSKHIAKLTNPNQIINLLNQKKKNLKTIGQTGETHLPWRQVRKTYLVDKYSSDSRRTPFLPEYSECYRSSYTTWCPSSRGEDSGGRRRSVPSQLKYTS